MGYYSSTGDLLRFLPKAGRDIKEYFGVGEERRDNRVEKGGWILGFYESAKPGRTRALATHFIPAAGCRGTPSYLYWPPEENIRLQREYRRIRDEEIPEPLRTGFVRLGWVHSHTFGTPVFVSSVDRENIRDHFGKPDDLTVILNPHSGDWKVFLGPSETEIPGIMYPLDAREIFAPASGKPRRAEKEKSPGQIRYEKRMKRQRERRRRKRRSRRRQ
ncbi:MAG: hypothetical protein IJM17_09080 [Firmicutes bacterium]|nr:hypothetical protein [Bacillota bacterium]